MLLALRPAVLQPADFALQGRGRWFEPSSAHRAVSAGRELFSGVCPRPPDRQIRTSNPSRIRQRPLRPRIRRLEGPQVQGVEGLRSGLVLRSCRGAHSASSWQPLSSGTTPRSPRAAGGLRPPDRRRGRRELQQDRSDRRGRPVRQAHLVDSGHVEPWAGTSSPPVATMSCRWNASWRVPSYGTLLMSL